MSELTREQVEQRWRHGPLADWLREFCVDFGHRQYTKELLESHEVLRANVEALGKERDEIQRKHDELGAIIIANKIQVQSVQRNRDLRSQLAAMTQERDRLKEAVPPVLDPQP